jgi:hypothetical protein
MKYTKIVVICVSLMFLLCGQVFAQDINTAVGLIGAGQQGQGQGQAMNNQIIFPETPTQTTVNQNGHGFRPYGNAQELIQPGFMPNVDTGNGPGAMYLSLEASFKLKNTYTANEAKAMTYRWTGTELTMNLFKTAGSTEAVTFVAAPATGLVIPANVELAGYVYANATKPNVPSTELLADLTPNLTANGIVYAVLLSEGFDKEMVGDAWVASAGYTQFYMASAERGMGVGGIGVGYGAGRSGMKALPFAKFAVFTAKPVPAPKKAEVTPAPTAPVKTTEGVQIEKIEPKAVQPAGAAGSNSRGMTAAERSKL